MVHWVYTHFTFVYDNSLSRESKMIKQVISRPKLKSTYFQQKA